MSEEEEAERLADIWAKKWADTMEEKGKTVTPEGRRRYREAMKAIATLKLTPKP